jgi:hypothetical protein
MLGPDAFGMPPEQARIHQLLAKINAYQHSLRNDRAVELDELQREGVLEPDDIEFLKSNSVTYKPHRISDYHALDMFHMPTSDGGCVFIGPSGPAPKKRRARLRNFQAIVESFLQLARPRDELLMHIEFSEYDGMSVAPEMICFIFRSTHWRERLAGIRAVVAECGLRPVQDEVLQGNHILSAATCVDSARTAIATVALLSRSCGFADRDKIIYSAGALDER